MKFIGFLYWVPIFMSMQTKRRTKINEFSNFPVQESQNVQISRSLCLMYVFFMAMREKKKSSIWVLFAMFFQLVDFVITLSLVKNRSFVGGSNQILLEFLVWEPNCSISGVFINQGSTVFLSFIHNFYLHDLCVPQ